MKKSSAVQSCHKIPWWTGLTVLLVQSFITGVSAEGFRLVKDIYPGYKSSAVSYMSGDRQLFFWAVDTDGAASESWTRDPFRGDVFKISNIDDDLYMHMGGVADLSVGKHQFFLLRRKSDWGYELWTGTSFGIKKLGNLPDSIDDAQTVSALGKYFFVPFSDPDYGKELWVSDGTVAETHRVKDIVPGTGSSSPHDLMEADGLLYFMVGDNLWESDGTEAHTRLVRSFKCDTCDSRAHLMAVVHKTLYIKWSKNINGVGSAELWRYETVSGQTSRVQSFTNLPQRAYNYAGVGDTLYFLNSTDMNASHRRYGLWKSNGTSEGTVLVKEWKGQYNIGALTPSDTLLYFHGGNEDNRELWISNGTSAGTRQVKDISGSPDTGSNLTCLRAFGNTLFFTQTLNGISGDFWISDGTEAGTRKTVFGVVASKCPTVVNQQFYFYGNDKTSDVDKGYGGELYTYDTGGSLPAIITYLLD